MQVQKPFAFGLITRCIEHRRRIGLSVTAAIYFPFTSGEQGTAWSEMSMWTFLGKEMPEGPMIDEGVLKLRSEYLVHGRAFAREPGTRQCLVKARVGAREKVLHASGPRYWIEGGASEAQPFDSVALDWSRAYGGADFAANPHGIGRAGQDLNGVRAWPLAQVEYPNAMQRRPGEAVVPASFAALDASRPQRTQYQGTYDDAWLKEQSPGFASDIDWRFFNLASADQWFDEPLRGNEAYAFTNMHPTKAEVGGELPRLKARCFINHGTLADPRIRETPLRLTTVWFFPHAERGILLYQGLAACVEDDASDLSLLMGAIERLGEEKPEAHYADVIARRLDARTGPLHSLRESDLLPSGLVGSDPDFEALQAEYRPEGLMADAQRRRAALAVDIARDEARAKGLDPDALKLVMPPPLKAPTLEELPAFVEKAQIEANDAQITSLLDAAEQIARTRDQARAHGIDPDALAHRGPPKYRAAAHFNELAGLIPAGARRPDGQLLFDAEAIAPKLRKLEAIERQSYLATAHTQPPARPMAAAHADDVRGRVARDFAAGKSFMATDLTGADLSRLDLRGADFTGAWLESANFEGALIAGCSFAGAVLAHADLSSVDATEADFTGANLGKARLEGARFVRAELVGVNLTDTALAQTDFRHARLDGATLLGATFGVADWRGVRATALIFRKSVLKGVVLHKAALAQPQFVECDLSGADFTGATLDRATFVQCKGDGTRFADTNLPGAVFVQDCDFPRADFGGARMKGSNLRGSILAQAAFRGADLDECDLSAADLRGADLSRATLRRALLVKTSLRAARLAEANLMEAVMQRADLRGADLRRSNLFRCDLSRVRTDPGTAFAGAMAERARLHPRREPEATAST